MFYVWTSERTPANAEAIIGLIQLPLGWDSKLFFIPSDIQVGLYHNIMMRIDVLTAQCLS